ncbi:MAG: PadR family transcriptional regulator [Hyphomonadaceae bacterium]
MPRKPNSSKQTRAVLSVLWNTRDDWWHGYDLSQQTGLKSGTLYPILMRLKEQGLLVSQWREPSQPGRPPRHVYQLSASGRALAKMQAAEVVATPAKGKLRGGLA